MKAEGNNYGKTNKIIGNIIVVEDTPENVFLLTSLLESHGHRLRTFNTGREAIESIAAEQPDLVLLDIMLPDLNGFEVCTNLKANIKTRDIPVIFLSALNEPQDKLQAFMAGGVDYITKPYLIEEVRSRVQIHLEMCHLRLQQEKNAAELQKKNERLHREIAERKRDAEKLKESFSKIEGGKIASLNLMEDLLSEVERRKQTEKKIQEAQIILQAVIESPQDMIILSIDKNYRYLNFNSFHKQVMIAAYGKDVKIGINLLDCITDENDRIKAKINYDRALNGESHITVEEYGVLDRHYYETRYNPIFDGNNEVIGATAFAANVTERKRAEIALRESEGKLSSIFKTVGDIIFYLGVEAEGAYRFITVNEAFCTVTGLSMEMITGKLVSEVIPEPSLSMVLGNYSRAIKENTIVRWVETSTYPTGTLVGDVSIAPVFDNNGHCTHLVGSVHDITQSMKAEEALKQSEEKFRKAFLTSPDSININRLNDGMFILINKGFSQIMGYSEEDIFGKTSFELNIWNNPKDRNRLVKGLKTKGLVENLEAEFCTKNGEVKYGLMSAAIIILDGESHILSITRDITDRKLAEKEILKLNQTLENKVMERTSQLEASNKELEAFSYSVSHDLRAPLRHISGFINLFLENKTSRLTDEELGYLNTVTNSANEMGKLIDALLSFSSLNRTELQKTSFDTYLVVKQGFQIFEQQIRDRGIEIKIGQLHETYGDFQLIRQVWTNLISNALKYTGKKEKAIIEIGSEIEKSETVFFIKDNGAGFDMKYSDKLFGVFQRLHKTRDFEGIGIGLANIKRIIGRQGGRCWANGEVNKGATFYFSLPVKSGKGASLASIA